jgi:hypothetical protein
MPIDRNLTTIENVKLMGFDDVIPHSSTAGVMDVIKGDDLCFTGTLMELWDWLEAGCPRPEKAVTHDGGPDKCDGAPSDGDLP